MWIDDDVLREHEKQLSLKVFVPPSPLVVLGSSNDANREVNVHACERLNVPIARRYGGGGTVVLYDGCVVLSFGTWVKDQFRNDFYFKMLNQSLIECLKAKDPVLHDLDQRGISDIVFKDKKIAGTSLFRSRNYLLYQVSLLIDLNLELVTNLLAHPSKEPDYRQGRSHKDFLVGLKDVCQYFKAPDISASYLRDSFIQHVRMNLCDELIEPQAAQMRALRERLDRSNIQPFHL